MHLLPVHTAGAAENMASDFMLLQRYPTVSVPRFRHYEWRGPACTFGYSQKINFVRAHLPAPESFDLCRRPTGGGIVDHRTDWTYALVIPRGHELYAARAALSYRIVHECLAAALVALGQPAEVNQQCVSLNDQGKELVVPSSLDLARPGVCFQRAELYDVVQANRGVKIAGAAQKRNKHGLLFQGSIEKGSLGSIDWDLFSEKFTTGLALALGTIAQPTPWPEWHEDEVIGLTDQYASAEWTESR